MIPHLYMNTWLLVFGMDFETLRGHVVSKVVLCSGLVVLVFIAFLLVCYKLEPVGYYYRWGSGVSDIPKGFDCDGPADIGGCDTYTCKSKDGRMQWAKVMFYKGELIDVFVRYKSMGDFYADRETQRSRFCYLDYTDTHKKDKSSGENYMRQDYYKCVKGEFVDEYLVYVDGQLHFNPRSRVSRYETYYEQCYDTALGRPWLPD